MRSLTNQIRNITLTFVGSVFVVCMLAISGFAQGTLQRQVKISNANGNIVIVQTDTPTTSYTLNLPNNPNPSLTTASLLYGIGDGKMSWSSTLGADSGNVMMLTRVGTRLVPSWSSISTAGFVNNGEPILTFSADNGSLTNNRVFSVGSGLSITNSGSDNGSLIIGNTGVLKLTAGSGISVSDTTGNIVISSSGWLLTGNTGTTAWDGTTGNYLGTSDNTDLVLGAGATGSSREKLRISNSTGNLLLSRPGAQFQLQGTGTGITTFQAGAQGTTNINYTLPTALPSSNGQALTASTAGVLSWTTVSGGGGGLTGSGQATRIAFWGPGPGTTTNLQDDSSLYWYNTNKRLSIGAGPSPTATLQTVSTGAATANSTSASFNNTATSSTNSITKTGLDIQSTGSWTGTGATNVGLRVNATGGTTNYAALLSGGNVGIGTSTPGQLLSLQNGNLLLGNNNATAYGVQFQGTGTGTTTLVAGAQGTTNITLTLPTAAPTANGQVLSSSTTGTLSWITPSSGGGLTGSGTATRIAFWGPGPGATTNLMDDASLYWDNTNKRLGIGTISPSSSIDVSDGSVRISNTTGTAGQLRLQGTGTGVSIFQAGAQGATDITYTLPTALPSSNGQALTATTAGVLSWASVSGGSSNAWLLTGNAGTDVSTNFLGTTDAVDLAFRTNNSGRMIIKSGGNIGIGAINPTSQLQVRTTDNATNARTDVLIVDHNTSGTTAAGFGSNILYKLQTTAALAASGSMRDAASIGVQWTDATDASRSSAMTFNTVNSGTMAEGVRIASNGYVGLNTTLPKTRLDINGAYATKQKTLTLSNGRNDNIDIGDASFVRIVGPTTSFSMSGISSGTDGKRVRIANITGQDWTIMDSSTFSSLGNRIETNTNSDIIVRGPVPVLDMIYDSVSSQWLLGTLNANQIIGSIGSIVYVYKTADESVTSSATIQDDDHLSFTLNSNETWELNGEIQVDNASNNIDIKTAFQMPTGSTMRIYVTGIQDAGGNAIQGNGLLTASNTPKTIQINGGVSTLVSFRGIIQTGSTAGALKFRWSQGVSNNSTTTVRAYSYMKIIRVK
jgi:hypothetical protein